MAHQEIAVTTIDALDFSGGRRRVPRRLGEFQPTNEPLSAVEIQHEIEKIGRTHSQELGWAPRSLAIIEEMVPLPEKDWPAGSR